MGIHSVQPSNPSGTIRERLLANPIGLACVRSKESNDVHQGSSPLIYSHIATPYRYHKSVERYQAPIAL